MIYQNGEDFILGVGDFNISSGGWWGILILGEAINRSLVQDVGFRF